MPHCFALLTNFPRPLFHALPTPRIVAATFGSRLLAASPENSASVNVKATPYHVRRPGRDLDAASRCGRTCCGHGMAGGRRLWLPGCKARCQPFRLSLALPIARLPAALGSRPAGFSTGPRVARQGRTNGPTEAPFERRNKP